MPRRARFPGAGRLRLHRVSPHHRERRGVERARGWRAARGTARDPRPSDARGRLRNLSRAPHVGRRRLSLRDVPRGERGGDRGLAGGLTRELRHLPPAPRPGPHLGGLPSLPRRAARRGQRPPRPRPSSRLPLVSRPSRRAAQSRCLRHLPRAAEPPARAAVGTAPRLLLVPHPPRATVGAIRGRLRGVPRGSGRAPPRRGHPPAASLLRLPPTPHLPGGCQRSQPMCRLSRRHGRRRLVTSRPMYRLPRRTRGPCGAFVRVRVLSRIRATARGRARRLRELPPPPRPGDARPPYLPLVPRLRGGRPGELASGYTARWRVCAVPRHSRRGDDRRVRELPRSAGDPIPSGQSRRVRAVSRSPRASAVGRAGVVGSLRTVPPGRGPGGCVGAGDPRRLRVVPRDPRSSAPQLPGLPLAGSVGTCPPSPFGRLVHGLPRGARATRHRAGPVSHLSRGSHATLRRRLELPELPSVQPLRAERTGTRLGGGGAPDPLGEAGSGLGDWRRRPSCAR